jgi:hypothetical protein
MKHLPPVSSTEGAGPSLRYYLFLTARDRVMGSVHLLRCRAKVATRTPILLAKHHRERLSRICASGKVTRVHTHMRLQRVEGVTSRSLYKGLTLVSWSRRHEFREGHSVFFSPTGLLARPNFRDGRVSSFFDSGGGRWQRKLEDAEASCSER